MLNLSFEMRRGGAVRGVVALLVAALSLLTYLLATFSASVDAALAQGVRGTAGKKVLSITDTMDVNGTFARYMNAPAGPVQALAFYEGLSSLSTGSFVHVNADQPVFAEPFPGFGPLRARRADDGVVQPSLPDPVLGNRIAYPLSTVSVDRAAWEAFGLQVDSGRSPDWSAAGFEGAEIPVVVGAAFARAKHVGDHFVGDFDFRRLTFVVVGVLRPNSVIYTEADPNRGLDASIVLPLPTRVPRSLLAGPQREFYRVWVSTVLRGDIFFSEATSSERIENEVATAAKISGFPEYEFVGASNVLVRYRLMREIFQQQKNQVLLLGGMCGLLLLAMSWVCCRWVAARRAPWVDSVWVTGMSRARIRATVVAGHLAFGALAAVGLVAGIATTEVKGGLMPLLAGLLVVMLYTAADAAHAVRLTDRALARGPREGVWDA